jgi:hypothetical protein
VGGCAKVQGHGELHEHTSNHSPEICHFGTTDFSSDTAWSVIAFPFWVVVELMRVSCGVKHLASIGDIDRSRGNIDIRERTCLRSPNRWSEAFDPVRPRAHRYTLHFVQEKSRRV